MHDELFKVPTVVARYRAGPYLESREQFLKKARADGYSPATLEGMAWALLVVAEIVHRDGGSITSKRLRNALLQHIRPKSLERLPSPHTVKLILQSGDPWLRSMGALIAEPERPERFANELFAFRVRRPSTERRRRGRRYEGAARARQGAVRQARCRRLDRSASEPDRHWSDRRR